jgi:hypothetical protein
LWSSESVTWGLQIGSAFPISRDLRVTTSPGFAPSLGVFCTGVLGPEQALRVRYEWTLLAQGTQVSDGPGLHQEIATTVHAQSLSLDYLVRPGAMGSRWSLGGSLSLIRWDVDSSNRLTTPGGVFAPSGRASWTRAGLGLLAGYRLTDRAEVEFRYVASHFGQENLPARLASLNLLLRF